MKTKLVMSAVVLGMLVACGGDSFSGTVQGVSLSPQEAIFVVANGGTLNGAVGLVMSDQKGMCDKIKANTAVKNTTGISFILVTTDSSGSLKPVTAGSYTVESLTSASPGGNAAFAIFSKTDASCQDTFTNTPVGSAGTVKLNSISAQAGGSASGTFDVTFGSDHVTGAFNATYCDAPASSSGTATCQ